MPNLTLLVLAAGMGSRYGGLKQLDPMGPSGETLLDYSVYDAIQAGFKKVVFVIRKDFEAEFRERVGARYVGRVDVDYVFQDLTDLPEGFSVPEGREKPWGTAHAIRAARAAVHGPFLAINADDFYGTDSYRLLATHLSSAKAGEFAMAGYKLRRTLSEHGSVSRGICQVNEQDALLSVREFTKLEKRGEGAMDLNGTPTQFTGEEPVSLNFWGFTPSVFLLLEKNFEVFLAAEGKALKSEFYIPSAVAAMVASGDATVKVLRTDATWFGVTYREDKPGVVERLARFVNDGKYPSPLWL
jgi:hypothetical protein